MGHRTQNRVNAVVGISMVLAVGFSNLADLQAQDDLAEYQYNAHLMPITNRRGFHVSFAELPDYVPLKTVDNFENYIARLKDSRLLRHRHPRAVGGRRTKCH